MGSPPKRSHPYHAYPIGIIKFGLKVSAFLCLCPPSPTTDDLYQLLVNYKILELTNKINLENTDVQCLPFIIL